MSAHENAVAPKPPALKRDWRFYSGLAAFSLSFVMPLGAVAVPWLGLPTAPAAVLAGLLVAGGPEVACILAVALLGKDNFQYITYLIKRALRRAVGEQPASRARYYAGLAMFIASWLPAYVFAYLPDFMPDSRIYILAAMDLAFVVSFIVMGGEFWEKMRRIFIYEGRI
jgi:hypothetical protein